MRIQRIELERFGRLDGQAFEFREGLNVVEGPNEAGKTTLRQAILFALFGNPRHATIDRQPDTSADDHVSWGSDRRFRLCADLVDEAGALYRVVKDWDSQSACLTDLQTGQRTEDLDAVQGEIVRIVGGGSLRLFRSTACVEQDAIDEISAGRREIGDQLQSIVTGGADEATASGVLGDLDQAIAEMARGWRTLAPRNPGPIKDLRDEIAEIDRRLADIRPQVERGYGAAERLTTLEARIAGAEGELAAMQSLRDLCDQRSAWERRLQDTRSAEAQLDRKIGQVHGAVQEIEAANAALGAYADLHEVDEQTERIISRLHQRVETLQAEIAERSAGLDQLRDHLPPASLAAAPQTRPLRIAFPLGVVGAGLVIAAVGLALGATRSWGTAIPVGLLGLVLLAGGMVWLMATMLQSRASVAALRVSISEADLQRAGREMAQIVQDLNARLAALGCTSYGQFVRRLGERDTLLRQRENATVRRDALLADQPLEALVEARESESRLRRDAEEALADPRMQRAAEYDALRFEQLLRDIGEREGKLADLRREAIETQTRRDDAAYTSEDVYRLEEQREAAEQRLAYLQDRLAVYELTREAIQEAKALTTGSARDQLSPRIGAYFDRLTHGRYSQVQVDDEMQLRVFSREKQDWIAATGGALSQGTLDQLYIAARLALLELLYPEARPPLLLDDPFVKFDAGRREQAVALCKEIARGYQVLLFTCHDGYAEAADWVIQLPGL